MELGGGCAGFHGCPLRGNGGLKKSGSSGGGRGCDWGSVWEVEATGRWGHTGAQVVPAMRTWAREVAIFFLTWLPGL